MIETRVRLYTKDYGGEEAILATRGYVKFTNDAYLILEEDETGTKYCIPWGSLDYMYEIGKDSDEPI